MSYREDPDLSVLALCSDDELSDLVECLTGKIGDRRFTETLTKSEEYKKYSCQYSKYWQRIAEELQHFGGNTFFNLIRRGDGVLYREILCDVCDKLKVNYNQKSEIDLIENNLLNKLLEISFDKMSEEEKKEFVREFADGQKSASIKVITPQILNGVAQIAFKAGGKASCKLATYIANAIWKQIFGKGLNVVANQTIAKWLGVWAGPIGWTITGIWTAADLAGPAFRVTMPAVVQIAFLRKKKMCENLDI